MPERQIMNQEDVRRALTRVAHEILEHNRGAEELVIVGIHTRGVHIARRIAANLAEFEDIEVPVATLDVSLYRDDNRVRSQSQTKLQPTDIPMGIQGMRVVLVDDVLYTGRTIRAAMDALVDFGRPQQIQLAILLDRGHRELPIRADYVGQNLPTAFNERVKVRLMETDGADEVALILEDLDVEEESPEESNKEQEA
ncbi:MAG: bifunctional pyr operon transcriptional regulator/uracil phosphoribosyltransferase PyrR [SAR202 cluster bacterium]|nr:bifunctional pyr operon transcriptional regulator/uracil phosphoribosyltransferase [Chloroflexota bacterium]MBU16441.1 bifunctional pyr operon transcriptional regulator/uracil phosphoribosyltransferase [Chloroflexota bacterium]MEC7749653.1 bifunctional pyr operon transcriptional regulator/uracil phosphoribosyltransferase PyrR [Chloroflexota bacterium]MQG48252.1 bifunctional pyr operon transcriptional regulator/uracil phosphoribosyltransferase PyrR [SAR202 cluster bacterium]MQG79142.1 bifunct